MSETALGPVVGRLRAADFGRAAFTVIGIVGLMSVLGAPLQWLAAIGNGSTEPVWLRLPGDAVRVVGGAVILVGRERWLRWLRVPSGRRLEDVVTVGVAAIAVHTLLMAAGDAGYVVVGARDWLAQPASMGGVALLLLLASRLIARRVVGG